MSKSVRFEDDGDWEDVSQGENGENENEELTIQEEYALWRKNCRYMYDFISETALTWPSLSVQWVPKGSLWNDTGRVRDMLITTHTSDDSPNHLKLASLEFPASVFGEESDEKTSSRLRVFKKYKQNHEINRARYRLGEPNVVATINDQGEVFVYHLTKSDEDIVVQSLKHHTLNGYGLSWNPIVQNQLLTASDDQTVALWDVSSTETELSPVEVFKHHSGIVNDVQWHKFDANLFGSVSDDKTFKLYDVRAKNVASTIDFPEIMNSVAFSGFSRNLFAVGGEDHNVSLFDLRQTQRALHVMMGHTASITGLQWDPHHENVLASGSQDRRVILWDITKIGEEQPQDELDDGVPELLMMHGGHTGAINDFDFSPEVPWCLASCSDDNIVHVWKVSDKLVNEQDEESELKTIDLE
ncbi:unnamed protein product [Kuraishia capsulata CBS 1993]|uniref:Histone-binding protein RBBP4-like N-terminal domain-containing protein n=1 Tax=Kuraishia capsulata CBS 1993 TaxID=1382522 RepID=W6MGU6_9ASCO|nr:uncharacterized protein KUCA_T00001058001 [Kuraishia capsulata CBS 1993]CDK25091.1 unnamed protein product [Kuraishia capsulata CBS 1993]